MLGAIGSGAGGCRVAGADVGGLLVVGAGNVVGRGGGVGAPG